jgi:FkbM family methyltransferase
MVRRVKRREPVAKALRRAKATAIETGRRRGLELRKIPQVFVEQPEAELTIGLDHLVGRRMMEGDPELFVVQVGAFDGQTNDPIHDWITRFGWRGVLVEPQARYFSRLKETYADFPKLSLRNVALSHESGRRPFYTVPADTPGVPEWVGQLASFDRSTIVAHQHLIPNIEELIRADDVECVTFEDLLAGVDRVDLLQVDAEGYDAEIIRMFDFDRWRPSIVNFESVHLSPEDQDSVMRLLVAHGYRVAMTGFDTLAYAQG